MTEPAPHPMNIRVGAVGDLGVCATCIAVRGEGRATVKVVTDAVIDLAAVAATTYLVSMGKLSAEIGMLVIASLAGGQLAQRAFHSVTTAKTARAYASGGSMPPGPVLALIGAAGVAAHWVVRGFAAMALVLATTGTLAACGGAQQVTAHAAITGACVSEEQRIVREEPYQEPARERLATLREVCDSLLAVVAAPHDAGAQ